MRHYVINKKAIAYFKAMGATLVAHVHGNDCGCGCSIACTFYSYTTRWEVFHPDVDALSGKEFHLYLKREVYGR